MAQLKTRPTSASVTAFMDAVEDPRRQADAKKLAAIMRRVTGKRARMWGPGIVGYGRYRYANAAGKEAEWMLTGFSPRSRALSIYIMSGFSHFSALMKKLGRHRTGKSCLYVRQLEDIDEGVLEELVSASVGYLRDNYETD